MTRVHERGALSALVRDDVRALTTYRLESHEAPIKLDQNENALGVPEPVKRALRERWEALALHRYPVPGQPRLRRAVAEACRWDADGVLVGNGSDQLLHTLARALLEPGRVALSPTPSFFVYAQAALAQGAQVVEVPLSAEYRYDESAMLLAIERHSPHVVFLCSPNNPTGLGLSLDALARIAAAAPGVVVVDEAYWEFAGESARALADEHPNLVLFRTLSKALAMAGIRVGYALMEPELRAEVVKVQPPYPVNHFSTEAALLGLEYSELAASSARAIVAERERIYPRLAAVPGITAFRSETNFHLIRTRYGARATFTELVKRGIVVRDVSGHPLLADCLRVTVGTPAENDAVCAALEDIGASFDG